VVARPMVSLGLVVPQEGNHSGLPLQAVQEVAEIDSNDPHDPDSKAFDVTAAMERALHDLKAGRWRPAEELINEL